MRSKEGQLQSECVKWFRLQYPQLQNLLFAIPNGGSRNIIEAANLKRQGVLSGVPDLFFAYPVCGCDKKEYFGMFVEMKYGKGRLTDNQKTIIPLLQKQGYKCIVVYSFDEFIKEINNYILT